MPVADQSTVSPVSRKIVHEDGFEERWPYKNCASGIRSPPFHSVLFCACAVDFHLQRSVYKRQWRIRSLLADSRQLTQKLVS